MIFRNDDIARDSNVEQLKEIQAIFEKHGIKEMYSVVPIGVNLYYGDPFTMELENLENQLGEVLIESNPDVVQFLKDSIAKGHSVSLHGWKHTTICAYTYEGQKRYISLAKSYLEKLLDTKITHFVAPFNNFNEDTIRICRELSLTLLPGSSNQLEWLVRDDYPFTADDFCWYHYWRFFDGVLTPERLEEWLNKYL